MGKAIVIKGVDYSTHGIAPEFERLRWIGLSDRNSSFQDTPNGRYISSGVNVTSNVKMVMTFESTTTSRSVMLSGCRVSTPSLFQIWIQGDNVNAYFGCLESSQSDANVLSIQKNIWDGQQHTIELSKANVKVDGVAYNWTNSVLTGSFNSPIYLDCSSQPATQAEGGYHNSYAHIVGTDTTIPDCIHFRNIKIYTDYQDPSSLVVDAIPVKRASDNVICYYNIANGEYLTRNDGSTPAYGTL